MSLSHISGNVLIIVLKCGSMEMFRLVAMLTEVSFCFAIIDVVVIKNVEKERTSITYYSSKIRDKIF